MKTKKKKPTFNVPNLGFYKSVKARWRKPRGTANKKRMKYKFMGALPKIGYRNDKEIRHLHPSGMKELLIYSVSDVEAVSDKKTILRIAKQVGMRKRLEIEKKAKSMNLKITNFGTEKENSVKVKKANNKITKKDTKK